MLNLTQKKKEINIYQNSMILEKYQNIFVEGETRSLDEKGVLIGHNFKDIGYSIFHNCDCHYGARLSFEIIDISDLKKDDEYIVIEDDEGFWLLMPYFEKYIPNFSRFDSINPIKSDTFMLIAEEMLKDAKELRNGGKTIEADFIEAFVWYFSEHKLMNCSSSDKFINIVGY